MRTKTYLLLLLVTGVISLGCAYLLLQYLNPEKNFLVAYTAMGISAVLASMSFIAIVLHFIKHLWYRGEVFSVRWCFSIFPFCAFPPWDCSAARFCFWNWCSKACRASKRRIKNPRRSPFGDFVMPPFCALLRAPLHGCCFRAHTHAPVCCRSRASFPLALSVPSLRLPTSVTSKP